jgi:hypothetical protein
VLLVNSVINVVLLPPMTTAVPAKHVPPAVVAVIASVVLVQILVRVPSVSRVVLANSFRRVVLLPLSIRLVPV